MIPNGEKGDTTLSVHLRWDQPLHFQRTRGSWKDNAWHLTLER